MKNNYKWKKKINKYSFPRAPLIISAVLLVLCGKEKVRHSGCEKKKKSSRPDFLTGFGAPNQGLYSVFLELFYPDSALLNNLAE